MLKADSTSPSRRVHSRNAVAGGLRVKLGGVVGQRSVDRRERWQRVQVDVDQIEGVFGDGACLGDDHRHAFADVAHALAGQRELRRRFETRLRDDGWKRRRGLAKSAEVEGVGYAWQRAGALQIDPAHTSVGQRTAPHGHVQHARQMQVVDVRGSASQQAAVFATADARAEQSRTHGDVSSDTPS